MVVAAATTSRAGSPPVLGRRPAVWASLIRLVLFVWIGPLLVARFSLELQILATTTRAGNRGVEHEDSTPPLLWTTLRQHRSEGRFTTTWTLWQRRRQEKLGVASPANFHNNTRLYYEVMRTHTVVDNAVLSDYAQLSQAARLDQFAFSSLSNDKDNLNTPRTLHFEHGCWILTQTSSRAKSRETWCSQSSGGDEEASTAITKLFPYSSPSKFEWMVSPSWYLVNWSWQWTKWWQKSSNPFSVPMRFSDSSTSSLPFRRNPNKVQEVSRHGPPSPVLELLQRPTLLFLLVLQTMLLYNYWKYQVSPSLVGLLPPGFPDYDGLHSQLWRLLTGAVSHFDLWHWGLNASALYQLSSGLEQRQYSSLTYLAMNLSWIFYVGTTWYALQTAWIAWRQRRSQQQLSVPPRPTGPTIGFSGVLFVWSTVTALQLPAHQQVCPIPMMEGLCFATRHLFGIRRFPFNAAPLVQLVVVQVLLPRVSGTGHLAGVLVGYAHVWKLLPWDPAYPATVGTGCALGLILFAMVAPTTTTTTSARSFSSGGRWMTSGGRRLGGGRPQDVRSSLCPATEDDHTIVRRLRRGIPPVVALKMAPHVVVAAGSVYQFGALHNLTLGWTGLILWLGMWMFHCRNTEEGSATHALRAARCFVAFSLMHLWTVAFCWSLQWSLLGLENHITSSWMYLQMIVGTTSMMTLVCWVQDQEKNANGEVQSSMGNKSVDLYQVLLASFLLDPVAALRVCCSGLLGGGSSFLFSRLPAIQGPVDPAPRDSVVVSEFV